MKKIRNSKLKAEYGKARVEMQFSDLTFEINNVPFVQVEPSVRCTCTYEYDRGYAPTEDDPGVLPTLEVVKVILRERITLIDEKHNVNIKSFEAVDIAPFLTEACLERLDAQVERELREEAIFVIDEPEDGLYSHSVPWRNSYNRLKAKRALK